MNRNSISTTQLAKICGVSQGTVDRALNNRKGINKLTKEKVLAAAKEYGYRPNVQGRGPLKRRMQSIGVILPDLRDNSLVDFADKLEKAAATKGFSTVIMFSAEQTEKETECLLSLYHMGVDGIVFIPVNSGKDFEKFLWSLDLPIITLKNKLCTIPFIENITSPNGDSFLDADTAVKVTSEYIIDGKPILDTVES